VNLLFVYFGAPLIGLPLKLFAAALLSLSLWGGANTTEIVRDGTGHAPTAAKTTRPSQTPNYSDISIT
jgi:polar amino acid transport system permease protein